MKVLILTAMWPTSENPALGSFVRAQAEHLQRAGIQVGVMVLEGTFRKLIYPAGVLALRRRLARNSIDVVHAHYGYVGMVARTQWQVPVVVTYHGDDVLGTIDDQGKTTLFSRLTARLCRSVGPLADAVIVQNRQMAERFRRSNVYIIPHEVDLDLFQATDREAARRTLGLHETKKYVLFAANPQTAVKRFPLAKAVVERLRILDPSVELLVVFKEPQPRLALYMSACDALVFPSYQEGSPNIVKQAMACNLPIVATDAGDVREILGDTTWCYICPPDVEAFAEKLTAILRVRPRTRGRDEVCRLAGPLVARRIIGVYEDTLRRRAVSLRSSAEAGG